MQNNKDDKSHMQKSDLIKPLTDNESDYNLFYCVIIFALFLLTFYPMLETGFTTNDDMKTGLIPVSIANSIDWSLYLAIGQGRFHYIFAILLGVVPYIFHNDIYYQLISKGSIIINIILAAFVLYRYTSSKELSLIFIIFFLLGLQNGWEHNLLTSYPFIFQFGIFFLLVNFLLLHNFNKNNNKKYLWAAAICFFFSLLIYEAFILYFIIIFMIVLFQNNSNNLKTNLFSSIKICIPYLVVSIIYFIAYLIWRFMFPTYYNGNSISLLDIKSILHVICQYSLYSFPPYIFLAYNSFFISFSDTMEAYSRSVFFIVKNMRIEWLIKAILSTSLIYFLVLKYKEKVMPKKYLWINLAIISVLLIIIPTLLLAVTPKYQDWVVKGGSLGYLVNYFSYYGVSLLFISFLLFSQAALKRNISRLLLFLTLIIIFSISVLTDFSNYYIAKSQVISQDKWRMVDHLLASEDFIQLEENSVIYAPSLWNSIRIAANHDSYWTDYFTIKMKKNIIVINKLNENIIGDNKDIYYIKFDRQIRDRKQYLLWGKLNIDDLNSGKITSNHFKLITYTNNKECLVYVHFSENSKGKQLKIDNNYFPISSNDHFWAHIPYKSSDPFLTYTIETDSALYLDNVILSYYTDFEFIQDIDVNWDNGFYGLEGIVDGYNWRWCDKQGIITFINNTTAPLTIDIEMILASGHPETSNLRITGDLISEEITINDQGIFFARILTIPPGVHQMVMDCDAEPVDAPLDSRNLVFRVINFKFKNSL